MRKFRYFALLIVCLLFAGTTAMLVVRIGELRGEQAAFEELAKKAEEIREHKDLSAGTAEKPEEAEEEKQILPEYEFLYQENPDLAGWIKIDDTRLDYPVMFTPEEAEFYLHRDFYGKDSYSGTPFIGPGYQPDNQVLMIFGHHMRNGTMFSDLMKYRDVSFWENHRTIQFDTLYEQREYEIFAAGYAPSMAEEERYVPFYTFVGGDTQTYQTYIQLLKGEALYETGLWPEGAPLLLLITCSYQETDGRFFVAGYQK